jgi:hypothetical protein
MDLHSVSAVKVDAGVRQANRRKRRYNAIEVNTGRVTSLSGVAVKIELDCDAVGNSSASAGTRRTIA